MLPTAGESSGQANGGRGIGASPKRRAGARNISSPEIHSPSSPRVQEESSLQASRIGILGIPDEDYDHLLEPYPPQARNYCSISPNVSGRQETLDSHIQSDPSSSGKSADQNFKSCDKVSTLFVVSLV